MTALKVPPHNIEIEQAVIGGLLLSPQFLDDLSEIVSASDFYRPEHEAIFKAMLELSGLRKAIDAVTVFDALRETVGAPTREYLLELVEGSRGTANILHYGRAVRDKARSRALISAGWAISELGFSDLPVEEQIEQAQSAVIGVGEEKRGALVPVSELTSAVMGEIQRRAESKRGLIGLETHFADLDSKTGGLEPGNLIIIAGRPSMGKTTFAMNISERVALGGGVVLVFSLEMPSRSLLLRSYSALSGIHFAKIRNGSLNQEDWQPLGEAATKLSRTQLHIDDQAGLTTSQLRARARRLQRKLGQPIDLIVVDYMQIMGDRSGESENIRISGISRNLKAISKEFDCPLIALSQLSRKVEERAIKRPFMSDLRDSGAIEQDADIVILMYRDEYYNENTQFKGCAEAIIGKQRNGETCTIFLQSELEYMRFTDFVGERPVYVAPKPKSKGFSYQEAAA